MSAIAVGTQIPGALGWRRIGNWLTGNQAKELLNAAPKTSLRGRRDGAIVGLLLGCGLRRSEVVGVRLDQLQLRDGHWVIVDLIGKGGRLRTVPVPSWCKEIVDDWKGARVRKSDVTTAKNYLAEKEISELNLIVTMFLDTADLRARRRQTMKLMDWEVVLDGFLRSNELPLLTNAGSVSATQAEGIAFERYESFDAQRREQLAGGEPSEITELERIAEYAKKAKKGLANG